MSREAVIGIDTSNYTTSAAAVDEHGRILSDRRILLTVKNGERGLRQQEALFQHVSNMPLVIADVMKDIEGYSIAAAACSVRPRPQEGSYMPVFNAGRSFAHVIADSICCPSYEFSHQEGHVKAAAAGTQLEKEDDFVFFHLSGGTTEAVSLPEYELCGRTLDISFGQLIDRAGVAMGLQFPCGWEMDRMASGCRAAGEQILPAVKVSGAEVNLSGIESACQRYIAGNEDLEKDMFCRCLFDRCSEGLRDMVLQIVEKTGKTRFLFAGGVSSSGYIRTRLENMIPDGLMVCFGRPELCTDNAVGTALLGGMKIWR